MNIIALIFVIGSFDLYAVTKPGIGVAEFRLSRGPASDKPAQPVGGCENSLVQDPFLRLLVRSKTLPDFDIEQWAKLAQAERPFNPLKTWVKTTDSVALTQALDREIAKIDGVRWGRLRGQISDLVAAVRQQEDLRQESRESTAPVLRLNRFHTAHLKNVSLEGVRWIQNGEKLRLIVDSIEETQTVFESSNLDIVNVKNLSDGGLAKAETNLFFSRSTRTVLNLETLSEEGQANVDDVGLLQIETKGRFLIRRGKKLLLRPLGRSRWTYWERTVLFVGPLTKVDAIGGVEDGYFLIDRQDRPWLFRFDGRRVSQADQFYLGEGGDKLEMARGSRGQLFIAGRSRLVEVNVNKVSREQHLEMYRGYRFWRDQDGRLALIYQNFNGTNLMYLEGQREFLQMHKRVYLPKVSTPQPPGGSEVVGAFRYLGNVVVAQFNDRRRTLQLLDLTANRVVSEMFLDVNADSARDFAIHQTPDGTVYMAVVAADGVLEIYHLLSAVELR